MQYRPSPDHTPDMSHNNETRISEKTALLKEKIAGCCSSDVAVAFSGGVDSSLLLKMACDASREAGTKVYGILLHTMLHPSGDVTDAGKIAEEIGAAFLVLTLDELQMAGIENNPADRCYLCKKYLFGELQKKAKSLGISCILEGTNADDLLVYRPGIRAVKELGIISPLADAGFTKADVRLLAAQYGISASEKPSTPCLATRFPYGTPLSYEEMRKAEKGEAYLRSLGFYNVRLRVHENIARIEVDPGDIIALASKRKEVCSYLKELGYTYITLDMEGFRSGSMDAEILKPKNPAGMAACPADPRK